MKWTSIHSNSSSCSHNFSLEEEEGENIKYGMHVCEGDIKLIHCNRCDNDMHATLLPALPLPIERKEFSYNKHSVLLASLPAVDDKLFMCKLPLARFAEPNSRSINNTWSPFLSCSFFPLFITRLLNQALLWIEFHVNAQ